jgi:hypothetical protein
MHSRIAALVTCITLVCAILLLSRPAAAYGEWTMLINGSNTPLGSSCPAMDGTDTIDGTFHWAVLGLAWNYSYDNFAHRKVTPPVAYDPSTELYIFDFTTDWTGGISDRFVISARPYSAPGYQDYYCTF